LPVGVAASGPGVEWGFVLAAIALILLGIPTVMLTSALPGKNAAYLQLTRLVHPAVGFQQLTLIVNMVILLTMLSMVFGYFAGPFLPGVPFLALQIGVILLFAVVTSFGVSTTATVQNVMVVLLLIALALFIGMGFPNIDPANITFQQVLAPQGLTFVGLGVTVVALTGALIGGSQPVMVADKVKTPRRDIPWAFIISTLLCMVLFMLVGYVTLGTSPMEWLLTEQPALQAVAAQFMSTGPLLFFSIAGGVFAIATTINSVFLAVTSGLGAVADDQVLPGFLSRKNRFGIEVWTIWVTAVIAIILILIGPNLTELMSAFGVANMLIFGMVVIPMFIIPKAYPKSFAKSFIRLNTPTMVVVAVLAVAMALWQILSVVIATPHVVITLLIVYAVFYIYFFIRKAWLKSKGVDMYAKMREVPQLWLDQEAGVA
jgi:amino acid transporter